MMECPRLKVLGCLCMIDQGELDWKVITIEESFAKQKKIKTLEDYDKLYPGTSSAVREWFRTYKTHDGKPNNEFGYDERFLTVEETIHVIEENHQHYKNLMDGSVKNPDLWLPDKKKQVRQCYQKINLNNPMNSITLSGNVKKTK